MKHRGPLVTLLVAGAAFAALVTANAVRSAGDNGADAQPPASAANPAETVTLEPSTPAPSTPAPSTEAPTTAPPTTEAPSTPPTGFPAKVTYAGRTADRRATIAIAVLNGRAAAYFCDGRSVEAWMTGTASGGTVSLRSKAGATARAQLAGDSLDGSITVDGRTLAFTAAVAKAPAGLYRARGDATTIGWIVLPDGSQVGISSAAGSRTPAPRLDPAQGSAVVGDVVLPVRPVTGGTVF